LHLITNIRRIFAVLKVEKSLFFTNELLPEYGFGHPTLKPEIFDHPCNIPSPNTAQPSPSEGQARLHIAPHLHFRPRFAKKGQSEGAMAAGQRLIS